MNNAQPAFSVHDLDFFYGPSKALSKINIEIEPRKVTALIGPSGCGKSTFLRCLNRMNDTIPGTVVDGKILLNHEDIYAPGMDLARLRQRVGMVFQKPNPFPQPVFENVAFGPRMLHLTKSRPELEERVQHSLDQVGLWEELKDNLHEEALS